MSKHALHTSSMARSRSDRATIILSILAALIAVVALFVALQQQKDETAAQHAGKVQAQGQAKAAKKDQVQFAKQVNKRCSQLKPRAEKASPVCKEAKRIVARGPRGVQGLPGQPGPPPTNDQIQFAVASYCQATGCKAHQPTKAQVAFAVRSYCDNSGRCEGPTGATGKTGSAGANGSDGTSGSNGKDGQAGPQGPPGPGPTDGQITDAVASYCSQHGCRGADGKDGATGPQGPQGPPGPACPDGYNAQRVSVETGESPINTDTATIYACVPS